MIELLHEKSSTRFLILVVPNGFLPCEYPTTDVLDGYLDGSPPASFLPPLSRSERCIVVR